MKDSFSTLGTLTVDDRSYKVARLPELEKQDSASLGCRTA